MCRVVHITPYDGFGGVETAVRSLPAGQHEGIEFRKVFISRKVFSHDSASTFAGPYRSENHPLNYLAALYHLVRLKPDIVIGSLWRSCIILLAIGTLRPRAKLVLFLHSAVDFHWIDYLCNRLAMSLASEIWTDSQTTLAARVPVRLRRKARIISFLTSHVGTVPIRKLEPRFIFWGRLDGKKGLERALKLFASVRKEAPNATYTIIGPDRGHRRLLEEFGKSLLIDDAVRFLGAKEWSDIRDEALRHSFYLQTSEVEGMAMSVVEAMQLGLVPIVTPVGEIGRYCVDGENSILVQDDARAAKCICELIQNGPAYERLATNARSYWLGRPIYRDCVLGACRELARSSA